MAKEVPGALELGVVAVCCDALVRRQVFALDDPDPGDGQVVLGGYWFAEGVDEGWHHDLVADGEEVGLHDCLPLFWFMESHWWMRTRHRLDVTGLVAA